MSLSGLTSRLLAGLLVAACLSSHAEQKRLVSKDRSGVGTRQNAINPLHDQGGAHNYYQDWLDEDARWIITPGERAAFGQLASDDERDRFIEAFWQRRDPTPDTVENEFEQEHYRRILYANEHFAAGMVPGWKSERGHIYIVYGPPDEVQADPRGAEAGSRNGSYRLQIWRYRYLEGVGSDVVLEFIDQCRCGDYRLAMNQLERDVLFRSPSGLSGRPDSFGNPGKPPMEPGLIQQFVVGIRPPLPRFKDLEEAAVSHKIIIDPLPFSIQSDSVKLTDATSLVRVTIAIQDRDLKLTAHGGGDQDNLNIFGRLVAPSGHVVDIFEDDPHLDVSRKLPHGTSTYETAIPLRMGRYDLSVALRNVNSGRVGRQSCELIVP
jgi:GWxTD domain-containing protein